MEVRQQQPYQSDSDYMELLQAEIDGRQEQLRSLQTEITALEQALSEFQRSLLE